MKEVIDKLDIIKDFCSVKENIKRLENGYFYNGNDLGATWTKERTTFKVWAPMAESVHLKLYKSGDTNDKEVLETLFMKEDELGVFCLDVDDDLNGIYYTYVFSDGITIYICI